MGAVLGQLWVQDDAFQPFLARTTFDAGDTGFGPTQWLIKQDVGHGEYSLIVEGQLI